MVPRIGELVSRVGKLGKMVAAKGKRVKNFSLFPMKRENAGCLLWGGTIFLTGLIGSQMGGGYSKKPTMVPTEEPAENMDEIIEKYGYSDLRGLGHLKSCDMLDTLQFFSTEDSLAYDRINKYANGLYKKAVKEADIAYDKADSIADRNYFVADSIGDAEWSKYYAKECEALNKGDLEAVRKYRKLGWDAYRNKEAQKSKVYRDCEAQKSKAYQDDEAAKSQACLKGEELKKEARATLGIIVRPYKPKTE